MVFTTQPRLIDVTVNRQGAARIAAGLGQAARGSDACWVSKMLEKAAFISSSVGIGGKSLVAWPRSFSSMPVTT